MGYPPSTHIVSCSVVDIGNFGDRLEGHLDFSYLMKLPIPQEDNEGLHLKVDLLE